MLMRMLMRPVCLPPYFQRILLDLGMRDILSAFSTSEARYFDEERYSEAEIRKASPSHTNPNQLEPFGFRCPFWLKECIRFVA